MEVPGPIEKGLDSIVRGEARYCLNLADALSEAGCRVDCFTTMTGYGFSERGGNLNFSPYGILNKAPEKEYDVYLDPMWGPGKYKSGSFNVKARYYFHLHFGGEAAFSCGFVDVEELKKENHYFVMPYPAKLPQEYNEKAVLIPIPFYKGSLQPPKWENQSIIWNSRDDISGKASNIEEVKTYLQIFRKLVEEFQLTAHFMVRCSGIEDELACWEKGVASLKEVKGIKYHRRLPYSELQEIISNECKYSMNTMGRFSGSNESAAWGVLLSPLAGGFFGNVAREMGIAIEKVDDHLTVGRQLLSDKRLYEEVVTREQEVIAPYSYENALAHFFEVVEKGERQG